MSECVPYQNLDLPALFVSGITFERYNLLFGQNPAFWKPQSRITLSDGVVARPRSVYA